MQCLLEKYLVKMKGVGVFAAAAAVVVLGALAVGAAPGSPPLEDSATNRTIDGTCNNLGNQLLGSAELQRATQLLRTAPNSYADGISEPTTALNGTSLQSAREISNVLIAQGAADLPNSRGVSDLFWQWGQFIDHDFGLTTQPLPESLLIPEEFDIEVPADDPVFTSDIAFSRAIFDFNTCAGDPREQINRITAYLDGSQVYGSDIVRATAKRAHGIDPETGLPTDNPDPDRPGELDTSPGGLLPFNIAGLENAGGESADLFLAGDIRANEQIYLTVMHTLFVREHNRLAREIAMENPDLTSSVDGREEIYQRVRKIVGAQLQVITYNEWLPLLLGPDALQPYRGYRSGVNPGIANEFSTAAFRFGHSMLPNELLCIDTDGNAGAPCRNRHGVTVASLPLADVFFRPALLAIPGQVPAPDPDVIDPFLRGQAAKRAQEVDVQVVDAVRNFLFENVPGAGEGFDLAAFNIQRARDHGLARLNEARRAHDLPRHGSFSDITSDPEVRDALAAVYPSVDDVELWPGGLAEEHVNGGLLGGTFHVIVADQFARVRDGDRWWHENDPFFTENEVLLDEVKDTTLADIIRRNTSIGDELQDDVFLVVAPPDCTGVRAGPDELWPPNHKFRDVAIAGVTDPDGDPVEITITGIAQDEPVEAFGDGNTCPDADGIGTAIAVLRSERSGTKKAPGDGRVYHVGFTAGDGQGGSCEGTVTVCVPHDQKPGHACVDQGPMFDSTVCGD